MTSSWLFARIVETGHYDELQLRIVARHRDRDKLAWAYFDKLPPWLREDIAAQWQAEMATREAAE